MQPAVDLFHAFFITVFQFLIKIQVSRIAWMLPWLMREVERKRERQKQNRGENRQQETDFLTQLILVESNDSNDSLTWVKNMH